MATLIDIAIVGTCVGFMIHNSASRETVHGDSGSMLLGYLITCASIVMTGRLDPGIQSTLSIYLPVFIPILCRCSYCSCRFSTCALPSCAACAKGQSPMHPDRMHLHHRMLRIGHSVQGAVHDSGGWASLIAFGSIMMLFLKAQYVLVGFLIAAALLTVATIVSVFET